MKTYKHAEKVRPEYRRFLLNAKLIKVLGLENILRHPSMVYKADLIINGSPMPFCPICLKSGTFVKNGYNKRKEALGNIRYKCKNCGHTCGDSLVINIFGSGYDNMEDKLLAIQSFLRTKSRKLQEGTDFNSYKQKYPMIDAMDYESNKELFSMNEEAGNHEISRKTLWKWNCRIESAIKKIVEKYSSDPEEWEYKLCEEFLKTRNLDNGDFLMSILVLVLMHEMSEKYPEFRPFEN